MIDEDFDLNHLCGKCRNEFLSCESVTYELGDNVNPLTGIPSIRSCSGFDEKYIVPRTKKEAKKLG